MSVKYESYVQGIRETAQEIGDTVPLACKLVPQVAEQFLDTQEYMRGQVCAIIEHLRNVKIAKAEDCA